MTVWKEVVRGQVGVYQNNDNTVEFLGVRKKHGVGPFVESLEDRDRIYLYCNNKRTFNGLYCRPPGDIKKSYLIAAKEKETDPEIILDYNNLKMFFNSKFAITVYRPLDRSPFAHYPVTLYGVETPLVPY